MKKGRLKYIIIILIIVVYGIGMYLVFGVDESRERRATTTLLIGDETVLNYTSRQWLNVTSQELLSSINWQDFNVYIDNEYFGNYLVWKDDRWYLFNQNREAVSYQGNEFFAYKAGFEMDVLPFQTTPITDFSYANQVLENHGLASNPSYTLTEVSSFDFDKDGVNEDFYIISNVFATDFFPDKYFSFVFMIDNNSIYMLYEDVDQNDGVNGCKPNLYTVADVDDDHDYEIVLMCSKYSNQTPVVMLYEFQDNAFKIAISNQ